MSACSFSIQTLNLVFTHGVPPDVHGGVHILLPAPHTIGLVPSLSGHAIATDGVHCRESVGTGPVVLTVVRVTGAAFASPWTKCYCAPLFSHTYYWYKVIMFKLLGVYQNISTAVLLYCFVETFLPPTLACTNVKSQKCTRYNIIRCVSKHYLVCNTAEVLTRPPPPTYVCTRVKSLVYTVHYHLLYFKT